MVKQPGPKATAREIREYDEALARRAPVPHEAQLVTLVGVLGGTGARGHIVHERHEVTGTLGTEGVTPTDGWAKWAEMPRRQRTSLTVLEGYPAYKITVPLLLDVNVIRPRNSRDEQEVDIEGYVERLEWMAGRGRLFKHAPGEPGIGEPPLVSIESKSNLVPFWCQNKGGGEIYWHLEDIAYNTMGREWVPPVRTETTGRRTRQAATLTLLQNVEAMGAGEKGIISRLLKQQETAYRTFTVGGGTNTFLKIAKYFNRTAPARIPDAAREIQHANSGLGASVTKLLPHGAHVRVPESATLARV